MKPRPGKKRLASDEVDPGALDLGHLSLFVGHALAEAVLGEVAAAGHAGLRVSHGYVFQHLIGAARTVGELGERLQVSQQAASKVIAELESLGYVERTADAGDGRVRRVQLTDRGEQAVAAARAARSAIDRRLARRCGADALETTRQTLARVLDELGGTDAVRHRRVVAPR